MRGLDAGPVPKYHRGMEELVRTNDPALVAFVTALLEGEGIDCFVLDVHMSVLEGSIGILPRRIVVPAFEAERARAILKDNGVPEEGA